MYHTPGVYATRVFCFEAPNIITGVWYTLFHNTVLRWGLGFEKSQFRHTAWISDGLKKMRG